MRAPEAFPWELGQNMTGRAGPGRGVFTSVRSVPLHLITECLMLALSGMTLAWVSLPAPVLPVVSADCDA